MRDGRQQGREAIVERQQRMAAITASSSTERTVDFGSVGPVGKSVTQVRFFHLVTVFWFGRKTIHRIVF